MKNAWPTFKRFQIEEIYSTFPESLKSSIEDNLLQPIKSRNGITDRKVSDIRRYIIQIIYAFDEDFSLLGGSVEGKLPLKTFRNFLVLLNASKLSEGTKNDMKCYFNIFLKNVYPDWSVRFNNFDDVKLGNALNEQRINPSAMLQKEHIEKIMKTENETYWKAFFITQYEAGLRTIEARKLKWSDVKFNTKGEISELNIYATKTKKARPAFVQNATFYLKKLRDEQENLNEKGLYIFHAKKDLNQPIGKSVISKWSRDLSAKSGIKFWPYLLRHSRATELYRLAKENKIAKDTALKFMGHSEDMSKIYTHLSKKEVEEMLMNQVYNIEEIPPEKRASIELEVNNMKATMKEILKLLPESKMKKIRTLRNTAILDGAL